MKNLLQILLLFIGLVGTSQVSSSTNQPFLETTAQSDTLIAPDRIYLNILLTEQDSKGKISIETLDKQLKNTLTALGIDIPKQLSLSDLSSRFKTYFLKEKDVFKSTEYSLLVYDAKTASNVLEALEAISISNVSLEKVTYSRIDKLQLTLKKQASIKAKSQANAMLEPLNQKVGNVLFISDTINNQTTSSHLQGRASGIQIRGASQTGANAIYGNRTFINIDVKKIEVQAVVHVKFSIEYLKN